MRSRAAAEKDTLHTLRATARSGGGGQVVSTLLPVLPRGVGGGRPGPLRYNATSRKLDFDLLYRSTIAVVPSLLPRMYIKIAFGICITAGACA
jgi:hypothetical protein